MRTHIMPSSVRVHARRSLTVPVCSASSNPAYPDGQQPAKTPLFSSISAWLSKHSKPLALTFTIAAATLLALYALPTLLHNLPPHLHPSPLPSPAPFATLSSPLSNLATLLETTSDLISQHVDLLITRLTAAPLWAKLFSMFLIGLPIIIPLGHLYSKASGLDLRSATLKMYALLYRAPGGSIIQDTRTSALIIANATYFAGVFVFAVLLGFVGDDVKSRLKSVRSGTYALHLQQHLLVLNWNRNTVPLLRQLALAQQDPASPFWQKGVVVLSGRPKADMDAAIACGLRGYELEVHTRTGIPFRVSDLRRVNAAEASAVLMLHPGDKVVEELGGQETTEALKAATLMTLFSTGGERCRATRVVVQGAGARTSTEAGMLQAVAKSAGLAEKMYVLETKDRLIANRLLAQTAMQPGLATVYSEIVQQGVARAHLLFQKVPKALQGQPYHDVRRCYPSAVLMGYITSSKAGPRRLMLNPPEASVLADGDRLVLLTRTRTKKAPKVTAPDMRYEAAQEHAKMWVKATAGGSAHPRRIMVAGWQLEDLPMLLESLAEFSPSGSAVTVVTDTEVDKSLLGQRGQCRITSMVAKYPTALQVLQAAGIKDATAVMVGGLEDANDVESEAKVLAALVQVQEACQLAGRKDAPHVVAKVRQPNTAKVARQYLQAMASRQTRTPVPIPTAEFLLPEEFSSAIISQVAAEADYQLVIRELLGSSEGQEIYIQPASLYYMTPGMTVTFAEVEEAARLKRQTALGLLLRGGRVMLVPDPSTSVQLREGDSIIVLAEDYDVCAKACGATDAKA